MPLEKVGVKKIKKEFSFQKDQRVPLMISDIHMSSKPTRLFHMGAGGNIKVFLKSLNTFCFQFEALLKTAIGDEITCFINAFGSGKNTTRGEKNTSLALTLL